MYHTAQTSSTITPQEELPIDAGSKQSRIP